MPMTFYWTLGIILVMAQAALAFWAGVAHGRRLGLPTYEQLRLRWENRLLRKELLEVKALLAGGQVPGAGVVDGQATATRAGRSV